METEKHYLIDEKRNNGNLNSELNNFDRSF